MNRVAFAGLAALVLSLPGATVEAADSDGDGLSDPVENALGTDSNDPDSDRDGLSDGEELLAGCDPRLVDTDADGLPDGLEVLHFHTDPANPDANGGGLSDGWHVYWNGESPARERMGRDELHKPTLEMAIEAPADFWEGCELFEKGIDPVLRGMREHLYGMDEELDRAFDAVFVPLDPMRARVDGAGRSGGWEGASKQAIAIEEGMRTLARVSTERGFALAPILEPLLVGFERFQVLRTAFFKRYGRD